MSDKFKIEEMKKENGHWTVRFSSVSNSSRFGAPTVVVDLEEFRGPEIGMHEFTPQEVMGKAHRHIANSLQHLFKASIMSIPGVDWENVRSLTISEILGELGLDDGA